MPDLTLVDVRAWAFSSSSVWPTDPEEARQQFRDLAKACHPDMVAPTDKKEAEHLFGLLNASWDRHNGKVVAGDWITIATRKRAYAVNQSHFVTGDIATVYPCTWEEGGGVHQGMMKFPNQPRDSDLIESEARSLKLLAKGDERWHPFVTELVDSFRHRDGAKKTERRVNVLRTVDEGFMDLVYVYSKFPNGLDPKDVAWMWRRLLMAIGFAHQQGVGHFAVLPQNILIHPDKHGLVLCGWGHSGDLGRPISSIVKSARWNAYPPEVFDRKPATEGTDIYMASKAMEWLMRDQAPRRLRAFINGCTLKSEQGRPHDAWKLREEFDELIEDMWGPKKFRPFTVPD